MDWNILKIIQNKKCFIVCDISKFFGNTKQFLEAEAKLTYIVQLKACISWIIFWLLKHTDGAKKRIHITLY
jgi:hypothetical protein